MRCTFAVVLLALLASAGSPGQTAPSDPAVRPPQGGVSTVRFDKDGWPIVSDAPAARAVPQPILAADPGPSAASSAEPARSDAVRSASPASVAAPSFASGMELGSPLLDVFTAVRSPGAFKALGGVTVWWRLTIYGAQGEPIGVRELTHTADCAFADRDRIEHADGRVYGRAGASVFAERQGMPWPTLSDVAAQELELFGIHLRMPWCFADAHSYAVVGRDQVARSGEMLWRARIERRPPPGSDAIGPEAEPRARDRFEIVYEPSTGLPREFAHRLASSGQLRRVLLEDWQDCGGVRMPRRRVYVDEEQRQTTMLELLRVETGVRTSDRDFRLR
jgi:hypothetical protein